MNRNNGFTIIELMLTIAVAGALLAVGVPSYVTMIKNNCLTNKTNAIVGAMQLARSTAITEREDVRVVPRCLMDDDNNGAADETCDNTNEFGDGVVVFIDLDADGFADTDIFIEDVNENGVLDTGEDKNDNGRIDFELLYSTEFTCAATVNDRFNAQTFTYTIDGTGSPVAELEVCDDRDSSDYQGRLITMSRTGRTTTDPTHVCP